MPKRGVLKSVAHNIADHAVSGLSYLHPHAAQVSRRNGLTSLVLDLISENPLPDGIEAYEPLRLSSLALREKFVEILEKEGLNLAQLTSAYLELTFPISDEYYSNCTCIITDGKGNDFRATAKFS